MPDGAPWRRHELARVAPAPWAAACPPEYADVPLLASWAERGWPVIVRRRMGCEEAPGTVPVGVPLPPLAGKRRIAMTLPEAAIIGRSEPVALETAAPAAPARWRPGIARLIALGDRHDVRTAAFGGLAWEHLTGLPYLTKTSDLDLLWPVSGRTRLRPLLDGISAIERDTPHRIDGEIILPNGDAAHWRELRDALTGLGPRDLLVKAMDGVRLLDAGRLITCGQAA